MEKELFCEKNGKELAFYTQQAENTRVVLQMMHGMAEHIGRYEAFARFLNEYGITFVGADLRGHGESFRDSLGYTDGDMWNDTVEDMLILNKLLRDRYRVKLVACGHSYGSFLTQALLERGMKADMFIFIGSCFMQGFDVDFASFVADRYAAKDLRCEPKMILELTFEAYNKRFGGNAAWLSRDQAEVNKYIADELCGFTCSANFYKSFFGGLKALHGKEALSDVDKSLPIRIFSGDSDPVGKYGKGVKKLYDYYKKSGFNDITMKLYEGGRHEIINETNKSVVYSDIVESVIEVLT